MTRPPPWRPGRRDVGLAALTATPWTWFGLRDRLGEAGDLVAVALPAAWVAATVVALVALRWAPRRFVVAWIASTTLAVVVAVAGPRRPADAGSPLDGVRVAAANILYDRADPASVDALLALDADVLVATEVTEGDVVALREAYAFTADTCFRSCVADTAVLSRHPLGDAELVAGAGDTLRVVVSAPHPFVLYAAHLSRPAIRPDDPDLVTFGNHHAQVRALADMVAGEVLPVVVAGDLNLSDRTRGYRLLAGDLVDATRSRWAASTYRHGVYRSLWLRIDHVFLTPGWCADGGGTFAVPGSDHRGVRATVGPCAQGS